MDKQQKIEELLQMFDGNASQAALAVRNYATESARQIARKPRRKVSEEVVIKIDSLVKTYSLGKNEVQALKGVSLDIHKGEFLALTGASGQRAVSAWRRAMTTPTTMAAPTAGPAATMTVQIAW